MGASLPSEPWDNLHNVHSTPATSPSSSQDSSSSILIPALSDITDFVSDLDSDSVDFSSDEDLDETESSLRMASFSYDAVLDNAHSTEFDFTYDMDMETSVSDTSPPPLSRTTSSSLSSLTRSTSFTSNYSGGSSDAYQWPSHGHSISSTESDSDILSSPPDDFLSFPTSRYSSNAITDPFWPSRSRFNAIDLEADLHDLQFSDFGYLHEPEVIYEPGTSADTVRPSVKFKSDPESHPNSPLQTVDGRDPVVDGVGWEECDGNGGDKRGFSREHGSGGTSGRAKSSGSGDQNLTGNGRGRFGGRGDEDDDEDDRRRNKLSAFSTPSDSELSDETEDESMDDYGEPVTALGSSDDDVPLAQRIPTALQAQRTIRRQVREERDKRRKERALRAEQRASVRTRQLTLRPAGAADSLTQLNISSSQEAARHATMAMRRPRTKTLPSNTARPFSPEDLSRRLQTVEVTGAPATRHHHSPSIKPKDVGLERPRSAGRGLRDAGTVSHLPMETPVTSMARHHHFPSMSVRPRDGVEGVSRSLRDAGPILVPSPILNPLPEGQRALRSARSFHKPERRKVDDHLAVNMPSIPVDIEQKLGRSLTRTRPRDESANSRTHTRNASPHSLPVQTMLEDKIPRRSGEEPRKLMKNITESRSSRPSLEVERPSRPSTQRPPVPPLPPAEASISTSVGRGNLIQQRVFIGDMQRFNMVEIGPSTNAGDVIEMVEAQGSLKGLAGNGNWMVWEIAQDFGMGEYQLFCILLSRLNTVCAERPVRSFELLEDIQSSWNKDKLLNAFMVRLTPLAAPLSRSVSRL